MAGFKYNPVASRSNASLPTYTASGGAGKVGKGGYAYGEIGGESGSPGGSRRKGGKTPGLIKTCLLAVVALGGLFFVSRTFTMGVSSDLAPANEGASNTYIDAVPGTETWAGEFKDWKDSEIESTSSLPSGTEKFSDDMDVDEIAAPEPETFDVPIQNTGQTTSPEPPLFQKTPIKGPALMPGIGKGPLAAAIEEDKIYKATPFKGPALPPDYEESSDGEKFDAQVAASDKAKIQVRPSLDDDIEDDLDYAKDPSRPLASAHSSSDLSDPEAKLIADPALIEHATSANKNDAATANDAAGSSRQDKVWTTGKAPVDAPATDHTVPASWTTGKGPADPRKGSIEEVESSAGSQGTHAMSQAVESAQDGAVSTETLVEKVVPAGQGQAASTSSEQVKIRVPLPGEQVRTEPTKEQVELWAGSKEKSLSLDE